MIVQGIECPKCKDKVWSRYTHDMRHCSCQYCFADGGRAYLRAGYGGPEWPQPWERPREIDIEVEEKK